MNKKSNILMGILIPIFAVALCLGTILPISLREEKSVPASTPSVEEKSKWSERVLAIAETGDVTLNADITGASSADASLKGGAIVLEGGTFVMDSGTISGHERVYGGAIYVGKGSTFTMNGGEISGNKAKYGGAVYVANGGKCVINGGKITANKSQVGPAIYVETGGSLEVGAGAEIVNNIQEVYEISNDIEVNVYVDGALNSTVMIDKTKTMSATDFPISEEACCGYFLDADLTKSLERVSDKTVEEIAGITSQPVLQTAVGTFSQAVAEEGTLSVYTKTATPEKLEFTLTADDTYSVKAKTKDIEGVVVIPRKHDGKLIDRAYEEEVDPLSLLMGGEFDGAFKDCLKITELYMPSSIVNIPNAFATNMGTLDGALNLLTKTNLCDNVSTIGAGAFFGCNLSEVTIPENVVGMKGLSFAGCPLETIYYNATNCASNPEYDEVLQVPGAVDNADLMVIFQCLSTLDQFYGAIVEANLVCGDNVQSIPSMMFGMSGIRTIDFGGVQSIGHYAFYQCGLSGTLNIGNISSIGNGAFEKSLGNVDGIKAAETNTKYTSRNNAGQEINCLIDVENKSLVCGCNNSVVVCDGSYTEIGDNAFYGCGTLHSVDFKSGITKVGKMAFNNCTGLRSVKVDNLEDWLNIEFSGGGNPLNYSKKLTVNGTVIEDLVIPESVTKINKWAFQGGQFGKVVLHNKITSIGDSAFNYTTASGVYFNGTVDEWCKINFAGFESNPLTHAQNLYINNVLVENVVVPEGVTSLNGTFAGATCLKSVTLNNDLTYIGDYAFSGCSSLENLVIPSGVSGIGLCAFESCGRLRYIYFLSNIINFELYVDIEDPASNKFPFNNDYDLILLCAGDMGNYNTSGDTSGYAWNGTQGGSDLTVYYNVSRESYESGFIIEENILHLYTGNENNVVIPDNITIIDSYAFSDCSELTSVTIPSGVTDMGAQVFSKCSGLTSVYIPSTVITKPSYALYAPFYGCLSTIEIYTDVADASSATTKWGQYWNNYSDSGKLTVHYGVSREQFEANS